MGWVEEVLEATKEAETPRSFIRWGAYAAISAVIKDQVFLDKFYYKLYPNIFVLLVAESGLRKGFAADLSKKLASPIDNNRIISGRNSIQAIIQDLSTAYTRPKKAPMTKSHGFIVSGELSTTFVEDPHTFTILTDLYDSHYHSEGWKYTLKGSGVQTLKDICVTMLGAINPPLFKSMITKKDITGGFIARTIIVEETKRALKNPLTKKPEIDLDYTKLTPRLKEISEINGQFQWSEEARLAYESWYEDFNPEKMDDKTGTANRIHDQILKVAMLHSLARDNCLILLKEDLDESMHMLDAAIKTATELNRGAGQSDFGPKILIVLEALMTSKGNKVSRSFLLRKYWSDFTHLELDVIIGTLEKAKAIQVFKRGRDEIYKATPLLLQDYEAYKGGIN